MSAVETAPIEVETPRPAAAWVMSLVASTTLWVTEQIPLWIIAVQLVVFTLSFATRNDPPRFRKSAVWLNVFMAGITAVTIRSALDGNPATISLAYFTALAQGLQLLDARPRKSEFVLVALALFQVILASSLTDSVFYPPLLLVFLAAVIWTLLVHTLSLAAVEAGDPAAVSRAIAPDLRRMTVAATCACLVLAMVLFVVFPRMKTHVLRGVGDGFAMSGFSDRVALGDVGRIRKDRSVVLRIEELEGERPILAEAYWRGLAFDAFDGRSWAISRSERVAARRELSGIGRFGIEFEARKDGPMTVQRVIREPVQAGVLFVPEGLHRIEGPFQQLELDRNDGLYLAGRGDERIRYTIYTQPTERDAAVLRLDRARSPFEPHAGGPRPAARYLALAPLDPRIRALGESAVAGAQSDFDRAFLIQESLRRNGRYTDTPPALGDDDTSPIEAFLLGGLEGHCEYFASAMVVLARSQGLPSRLVNGFAGGVRNELGGFIEVTQADAHAWVEIHFEDAGWVRFDPTPPDLRLRDEGDLTLWARVGQLGSAVEIWWFQRVVDFDSADQIGALRGLWLSLREGRARHEAKANGIDASKDRDPGAWLADVDPLWFAVAGLVAMLGYARWRWTRARADDSIPKAYREAQRILAPHGFVRDASTTARAFATVVRVGMPDGAGEAFDELTEHYLAERFGGRDGAASARSLAALKDAVDRMRLRDQPHVG